MRLSSSRYHSWCRSEAGCDLDDQPSCPRVVPTRLTPDEIENMRNDTKAIKEATKDMVKAIAEVAIINFSDEEFLRSSLDNTELTEKKDQIREKLISAVQILEAQDINMDELNQIYHISNYE